MLLIAYVFSEDYRVTEKQISWNERQADKAIELGNCFLIHWQATTQHTSVSFTLAHSVGRGAEGRGGCLADL